MPFTSEWSFDSYGGLKDYFFKYIYIFQKIVCFSFVLECFCFAFLFKYKMKKLSAAPNKCELSENHEKTFASRVIFQPHMD